MITLTREEVQQVLAEYDSAMQRIGGCTDGGCVIQKPVGMHTNGGCRCWKDPQRMQRAMRAANNLTKALRARLAQPEPEPVAWRTFDGEGGYEYRSYEMNEDYGDEWLKRNPNHKGWVEPLYTAPPQREWQGLTAKDLTEIPASCFEGAIWADAKLRKKNG